MILLDTSALLALAFDTPMRRDARAVLEAEPAPRLHVSAATAWELGLLATRTGRTGPTIGDARLFYRAAVSKGGLIEHEVTAAIGLEAAYLPEPFHRDPVDRWIVATARVAGLTLVTSDRAILAYARAGHVGAIAC